MNNVLRQKFETTLPTTIPMFQTAEEHLRKDELEPALSVLRSILLCVPHNFYASMVERRLRRILQNRTNPAHRSPLMDFPITRMVSLLEHVRLMYAACLRHIEGEAALEATKKAFLQLKMEFEQNAVNRDFTPLGLT